MNAKSISDVTDLASAEAWLTQQAQDHEGRADASRGFAKDYERDAARYRHLASLVKEARAGDPAEIDKLTKRIAEIETRATTAEAELATAKAAHLETEKAIDTAEGIIVARTIAAKRLNGLILKAMGLPAKAARRALRTTILEESGALAADPFSEAKS